MNPIAPLRATAAVATALAISTSTLSLSAPADATSHASSLLKCLTAVSDKTPAQNSTVTVYVNTVAYAKVTTVAHYRTTNTKKKTTSDHDGKARTYYDIGDATPGYRVKVDVYVYYRSQSGHCTTGFTPHR